MYFAHAKLKLKKMANIEFKKDINYVEILLKRFTCLKFLLQENQRQKLMI
jgi:hypothetical protein